MNRKTSVSTSSLLATTRRGQGRARHRLDEGQSIHLSKIRTNLLISIPMGRVDVGGLRAALVGGTAGRPIARVSVLISRKVIVANALQDAAIDLKLLRDEDQVVSVDSG